MKPAELKNLHEGGKLVVFGEGQPEYVPLQASVDDEGTIMCEWELSAEDLAAILRGGRIRLWMMYTGIHFGERFKPLSLEVVEES